MHRLHLLLIALATTGIVYESASYFDRSSVLANISSAGSVSPASPMLEPRSGHTATLLQDGKVLIAGGMRRNRDFYTSAELFDPATGKFQATGAMSVARVGHAAVLLRSGKVLVIGGWVGPGCTDSAELYDPATGIFTALSRMNAKRGRPTATLLASGEILIAGGADHDTPGGVASAEIFHAVTSKFESVGPMHTGRISQTAMLLNDGHVLIVGGRGEAVTASAELYEPISKQFVVTGSLHTARYKHSAGKLPDGRVLIVGGSDERDWQGTTNSAEIYDPRTGRFSATSPLNESRFKLPEEAAQLASGQLLVAGGSKKVEVYDPASGKFLIAAGQLADARHFMSETRLKDGSVLLAGGYPNNDQSTAETWIYHPAQ
ncbi:MAG: Kelch repeat protein [Candidatus Acidoferrum typicum]|nr:Kelch repeat protein [Candidatus Acidoferrum typicum]